MLPRCPSCGSEVQYQVIHLGRAFKCPACENDLIVSDYYSTRAKVVCFSLTALLCFFLACKDLRLLLLTPVVFFVVVLTVTVATKRIFRPPLEHVVSRSKEARYIAL